MLATALEREPFVVAARPSVADLALNSYVSVAGHAGLEPARWPAVASWLDRVRELPGLHDGLVPDPAHTAGAGRSGYDG